MIARISSAALCRPAVRSALAASVLQLAAWPAAAGLFDDEEARRAIVDLRARVAAVDEAAKARHAESVAAQQALTAQVAQMNEALQVLRRSLLDLSSQIEAVRAEMAKLRGSDEQLAREVAELQKRQKDVSQALDDRLRKLEPVKVTLEGNEFLAEPDEKRAYDEGMARMRAGEFDKAATAFANFQRRYAGSGYIDMARFWQANALYGKGDHKEAIAAFRAFVAAAPDHPKAPEALLSLANSQVESKDGRGARRTIDELMKSYPKSEAAAAGKERLASIKP